MDYTPADQPPLPSSAPPPDPPQSPPPPSAHRSLSQLTAKCSVHHPSGSSHSRSRCVCPHPIQDNHALQRRPVTQPVVERFRGDTVQRQESVTAQLCSVIGKDNPADTLVKRHVGRSETGEKVFRLILATCVEKGWPRAGLRSVPLSSFPGALLFLTQPRFRQRFTAMGERNQPLSPCAPPITHPSVTPYLVVPHTE